MNINSIRQYLRHYGKIRTLRGSAVRSTFLRVQAGFDACDEDLLDEAMKTLEQDGSDELHCVYCGADAGCWDHLMPAARGGTHQIRNLAPCCADCNQAKGAKTWQEFLDDQPETAAALSARRILEEYTAGFVPKALCVSASAAERLAAICDDILAKMTEADEIIARELNARSKSEPQIS